MLEDARTDNKEIDAEHLRRKCEMTTAVMFTYLMVYRSSFEYLKVFQIVLKIRLCTF